MDGVEASEPRRCQRRCVVQNGIVDRHDGNARQDLLRAAQRSSRATVGATQRPEYLDAREGARNALSPVAAAAREHRLGKCEHSSPSLV